jgi:uncharacterized protein (TIGR02246 family)
MKKTTLLGIIALAGMLAPVPARAQDSKQQAIVSALTQFAEAFNARDAAKAAATFDKDGTLVNARGESLQGRDAIEKGLATMFAGPLKQARIAVTADSLRPLTKDVSVQADLFYIAGRKDASGKDAPLALSHYMIVWVQRADGWRIAALQAMVPAS